MKERKYYYKVVKEYENKIYSCVAKGTDCEVIYKKNKWVKPHIKNSKLFVFETRKAARNFKKQMWNNHNKIKIYKVEIKNPIIIELYGWCNRMDNFRKDVVQKEWKISLNNKKCPDEFVIQILPEKTVFVDEVKLIERVR